MKKIHFIACLFFVCSTAFGKKVKFAVDMTGQTISPNGVHVMGDFQALAGLGTDWNPSTASLTQEGSSNIYSIIVNIPAFRKYEYRFLNGDQTYEAEFVPEKSRVDEFIDNRWLYVDSLSNDTSYTGSILFAGNAPAGKTLLRYKIDLRTINQSSSGIHVGNSYQSTAFSPTATRLYDITGGIYEIINFVNTGTYAYIFYNGNTAGSSETVPSACAVNGKRSITVNSDTVMTLVCFSSCAACVGVGITENTHPANSRYYPNPAGNSISIENATEITITDMNGGNLLSGSVSPSGETLDITKLQAGLYFVSLKDASNHHFVSKLVKE